MALCKFCKLLLFVFAVTFNLNYRVVDGRTTTVDNNYLPTFHAFNPLRINCYNEISIDGNSSLIKWIQNSMRLMEGHGAGDVFYSKEYEAEHYKSQKSHYKYVYRRVKDLSIMSKFANDYLLWYYATNNNIKYIKNILNNTIYYHVECPDHALNINLIVNGQLNKLNKVIEKCENFRWIVKKVLSEFKLNMFEFIELPSEVMDNNMFVKYNDKRILTESILNFAFVNKTHNFFYYKEKKFMCKEFVNSTLAHVFGSSIHINANYNYCVTYKPYAKNYLYSRFKCIDLFFLLAHELAHYFISDCHIEIPFLQQFSYSMQRSLDKKSQQLMVETWQSANKNLHCNNPALLKTNLKKSEKNQTQGNFIFILNNFTNKTFYLLFILF